MDKYFKYKFDDLFEPTLEAMKRLGGSGSIREIENEVTDILALSDMAVNEIHREGTTKLVYRLAWARNYLKRLGLLENSSRAVWSLTDVGKKTKRLDKKEAKRLVYQLDKTKPIKKKVKTAKSEDSTDIEEFDWKEQILQILKRVSPDQFERLCQRLLRELGFVDVEVTGRTNDGGIDGNGILRLGGMMSFHVVFQAKRFKGSVSSSIVRDFRGAMVGRAEKGVIMTTGYFTREAQKEASRDGAPPVDLFDGNDFAEKLKDLGLGVSIELVEKISIDEGWFKAL